MRAEPRCSEELRSRILHRRLTVHHLTGRLPPGSLSEAAGACGVQNTPNGSAELSLSARVEGVRPEEVTRALENRALVQAWSLRASPHIFPADEHGTFTLSLLPQDERSLLYFIRGAGEPLSRAGMSAGELMEMIAPVISEVLDGRGLTKDELGREVADRLAATLPPERRTVWNGPDRFGRLGETLVRYGMYLASLGRTVCHGPLAGTSYLLVRPDQWLPAIRPVDPRSERTALVRKYLHCYGPSTIKGLADWAGVSEQQASSMWFLVSDEMEELDGTGTWMLREDMDALDRPPAPEGTRLLPPHDPYLQMRDRELLVPDRGLHRLVWRAAGNPGAVLHRGDIIGTWRPRKKGRVLSLEVTPFDALGPSEKDGIDEEAETMSRLRQAEKRTVTYTPPVRA